MNENDKSRSGLQTAVDFAHAARAAKRIMQAAAASGVHGAAAATAREAFPLLLKVLIAVLVVFIAVPMVIFTALPNIFFGYNSSGTDTVVQMTQQAMTLGGVYMTLGNFEGAQIDSVVTGIAAEYEKNGTTIDHIVVSSAMTDDDLLWVIAINSAAHQQDLNTMSADLIRNFCKSSLSYTPSLSFMDSGDDGVVTTLRIEVKHLDPEKLMDELGFDSEARQWAGALYETLEESDAINKYKSYYEAYQPGYWNSAKQLATCLKALGGTITLGIAQSGMLTISTQDAYYLQNAMRAPTAKKKSKKAIEPPAANAA